METILITGGNGFIGSHICTSLIESGYRVVILDSLINSSRVIIDKIWEISKLKKALKKDLGSGTRRRRRRTRRKRSKKRTRRRTRRRSRTKRRRRR